MAIHNRNYETLYTFQEFRTLIKLEIAALENPGLTLMEKLVSITAMQFCV